MNSIDNSSELIKREVENILSNYYAFKSELEIKTKIITDKDKRIAELEKMVNDLETYSPEIIRLKKLLDENNICYDMIECQSKTCSNKFVPSRRDQVYCSDTCKNRARQQRHRAKLKDEGEVSAAR